MKYTKQNKQLKIHTRTQTTSVKGEKNKSCRTSAEAATVLTRPSACKYPLFLFNHSAKKTKTFNICWWIWTSSYAQETKTCVFFCFLILWSRDCDWPMLSLYITAGRREPATSWTSSRLRRGNYRWWLYAYGLMVMVMLMMILIFFLQLQGSHVHGRWCRRERVPMQVWIYLQLRQLHLLLTH